MDFDSIMKYLEANGLTVRLMELHPRNDYSYYWEISIPASVPDGQCSAGYLDNDNIFLKKPDVVNLAITTNVHPAIIYDSLVDTTFDKITPEDLEKAVQTIKESCDKLPQLWNKYTIQDSANDLKSLIGSCSSE